MDRSKEWDDDYHRQFQGLFRIDLIRVMDMCANNGENSRVVSYNYCRRYELTLACSTAIIYLSNFSVDCGCHYNAAD